MSVTPMSIMQMLLTVVTIAAMPLAIVWTSSDVNKYRKLVWLTLFLTFDLVVFGGFTRATDSGLGCPDWPGCYGHANPLQANGEIAAAQSAMPTGPVTELKAWIEMIHRYFAGTVTMLIVAQFVIAWWTQRRRKSQDLRFSRKPPLYLLGLIVVQIVFGALTVTLKLQPVIVTTHLLLGLTLLASLAWFGAYLSDPAALPDAARTLRRPALIASVLLVAQVALGGWTSTNYAAVACGDYPTCQGQWLPPMDFADGFTLWRALGKTAAGAYLPFDALTAIHWVHRNFALVVVAAVGYVAIRAIRYAGLRKLGSWILVALVAQFATGLSIVLFKLPLLPAVAHNAGAALLVALLVMVNYRSRNAPREPGPQ
ncbi:MAG TPA: COX15/CtaA family protein [Burkholderiaceae bacterium]